MLGLPLSKFGRHAPKKGDVLAAPVPVGNPSQHVIMPHDPHSRAHLAAWYVAVGQQPAHVPGAHTCQVGSLFYAQFLVSHRFTSPLL